MLVRRPTDVTRPGAPLARRLRRIPPIPGRPRGAAAGNSRAGTRTFGGIRDSGFGIRTGSGCFRSQIPDPGTYAMSAAGSEGFDQPVVRIVRIVRNVRIVRAHDDCWSRDPALPTCAHEETRVAHTAEHCGSVAPEPAARCQRAHGVGVVFETRQYTTASHSRSRAARAAAPALKGAPKSRGSDRPRTPAGRSRSANASSRETAKPARTADAAAALPDTPAISTRAAVKRSPSRARAAAADDVEVIEHGAARLPDAQPLHQGGGRAARQAVGQECCALRSCLACTAKPVTSHTAVAMLPSRRVGPPALQYARTVLTAEPRWAAADRHRQSGHGLHRAFDYASHATLSAFVPGLAIV